MGPSMLAGLQHIPKAGVQQSRAALNHQETRDCLEKIM